MNNSALAPATVDINTRIVADLLKFCFKNKDEDSFTGLSLRKVFLTMGQQGSFLQRKGGSLSGSYCAKILTASMRVVDFLKGSGTPQRWRIEKSIADETEETLRNLLQRYRKLEKQERARSREDKDKNILTPMEISKILQCKAVKDVLETAAKSLDDENIQPVTSNDATSLRNALITSTLVRSLRRALEFTEFTVGEW